MQGIEFIASFVKDPLIKSANAILSTFRNLQTQVTKVGGDIDEVFRRLADRGQTEAFERRAMGITNVFMKIVGSIGIAADASDDAKLRISKAMEDFANSAEKPKVKFQNLMKEMASIFEGIKNTEAPLGDINSTSALSSLEKRLKMEEEIIDVLKQQREEAEKLNNTNAEGIERNKAKLEALQSKLDKKYNGQAEGFYSESDIALLEQGRESVANWTKAWEESNTSVQTYDALITEATGRTDGMKKTIDEMRNVYTGFADTVESSSTKIFISEDVFNRYHELSSLIEDLKAQISSMPADDINLPELERLQGELSSAQDEFRMLDSAARNTAAVLGQDLADKVSAALSKLYDLNDRVRKVTDEINGFDEQLKKAKLELAEAKEPLAIKAAREEVDRLQVSLDGANDRLTKFKAEQKDAITSIQKLNKEINGSGGGDASDIAGEVSNQVKSVMGNVAAVAGIGFGLNEIKDFFDKAKEWRTYFQDIESSMKVFLGSAEKGAEFTEKLQMYAYYNMFEFSDLAAASQQMISYGHNVESIIPRLDQLSNVATGTHGSLMELVDAYNRAKATGVVDARGIQSWAVKGVMIRDVLRDMGETVAGTTVTFDQLNKVLDHVTSEGGMFHNLMGEMMNNISAEAGQLEDNLSLMFNEIGEKYEGVFIKLLKLGGDVVDNYQSIEGGLLDVGAELANSALDELAENWQTIVSVIKEAIVTYGVFKTVMIAHNAYMAAADKITRLAAIGAEINAGATTKEALAKKLSEAANAANAASEVVDTTATNADTVAKGANTTATVTLSNAVRGLTASLMANPFVLVATAIAGIAYACYSAYEGIMTEEKAQKMLNNAAEEYSEKIKAQEQADRTNIGIIQDKTKSLIEQTKAYRELIAESEVFAKFSKEEIAGMSTEQINQLKTEENARKEEEGYRKRLEALEELQKRFAGRSSAWLYAEEDEIKDVVNANGLGEEFANELIATISGSTDLSDWSQQAAEKAGEELQNYLKKGAEDGVVEGFRNGFSNPEALASAQKLLSSYRDNIEEKTSGIQSEIDATEKRIADLRKEIADSKAGINVISDNQIRENVRNIQDLNDKLKVLSQKLIDARKESSETFQGTLNEQIDKASKKVDDLHRQASKLTGTKRLEIEAELKKAVDERDTWKSLSKLIEAGTLDTELVLKVTREVENNELGDEKLVEIGKDYERIESIGQDVATQLENVKKRYEEAREAAKAQGEESHVSFAQMMEDAGLTAEGIDNDFSAAKEHISKDITELEEKQKEASEESEKHKLQLEIDRKQEQLNYIDNLSSNLKNLIKDPFNIKVKIESIIPEPLKKLFNKLFGINFDNEKAETSESEIAQSEAADAQQRINEKKNNGPDKKTGAQWKKDEINALKTRKKELEGLLKTELTQADAEKYEKELSQINSALKKGADAAKKILDQRAKMLQDKWKYDEEMKKLQKDSSRAQEDATIASIVNNAERERAEREAQHKRTIADIKAQEDDIYKSIYEQRKKTYELNNKDKKYENTEEGSKGWQGVKGTLTKEEQKYYDERNNIIKANLQKEDAEWGRYEANRIKEQAQSMREYLSQYGTFQQQRLAIAEEYAEKIAEAEKSGNEWEVKKLEAERDTKVAQANAQSLAMNIDWNQTFSGIGNVLQDIAKETLRKVNDYMQTAEFRALGADAKKAYQDLKQQLIDAGGQEASNPFSSKTWDEIAALTKTYQGHVKELAVATELNAKTAEEYEKAKEKKKNAEVEYAKALEKQRLAKKEGIDTTQADSDVEEARKNLAEASQEVSDSFKRVQETSAAVSDQQANVNNTQQQLHQKTDAAAQGLQNFNTVLGQLTSGTLSGFVEGVSNVINALTKDTKDDMKGLIGVIGQKAGGIIGAILSIIDMLGDKPVEFFDSLFDGLTNVIKAVISHIPEIIASVIKGIGSMIGGIFEGIGGLFGFGSADNHQEMLDRQEKYNSMLDDSTKALDRFTQELEKSYGALAIQNAEGAEDIIKKNMETIMKGIDSVMWDNYGGGHSDYWHANKALNWTGGELERAGAIDFFKRYGLSVFEESQGQYTWNQLFNGNDPMKLAEAFKDMRDSESNLWRIITTEMGANSGALKEWIEKLIDAYDQIDENQKKMQEQLTTTTSENVFDDFLDSLYNLADGSEDVMDEIADNWQQMVNKIVINNTFGKRVDEFVNGKDGVKGWYERLADLQKQYADNYGDQGYKDAIDVLKKEYSDAIESINTEMDALRDTGLIAPIKEAAEEGKGAFQEMTDSWVSSLMDFGATAEDWAENIGQAMAQKIINEMVVPTLIQPLLDNLQTAFDNAMEENTFTESSGKKAYYWTKVLDNEGLKAAMADINNAYPELKETVQGIMSMAGIEAKEEFSNSLDGIGDTLIDNLLSLEDDAEDIGKKVGSALIREMIEQMLASGDYAERMEAIRQMWQDVLTGKDTTHTRKDIISDLRQLQEDMANDQNMTSLVSEWKDLNKELEKTKQGFSDLRSTITNSLTSAESTIEDFSKSLGKSMMSQMLDAYIDSNYKDQITALSEEWGEALAAGNTKAVEEIQQKVINLYKTIGDEDIEVKNLADAIREIDRVLDTTFKDMKDSWVSALSDMEGTAEEFAENVGKTMAQKIISEMIAPMYIQPLLDAMQEAYDSAIEVQGASVESVINTMSPYLDQVKMVYNEIQPMVENIFGGFGIYKEAAEEAADEVEYRLGDLKSNFSSALMDMENSAADFSKDISKVLAQNFIENFVLGDRFDRQMKYWQEQYESIIGSGMSEDERKRQLKALRDSIATAKQGYVNSAMAIQELLGITAEDKQEATMNMADKITYDQADQLLGINLAQELTLEQILATLQGKPVLSTYTGYSNDEVSRQVASTLQGMKDVSKVGNDNMLIQLATANSHLQLIRDYSKTMRDEVMLHLGSIDSKLSNLRNL